ncbi:MAG: hypothetical protein ACOC3J_05795 [Gemmatimonadota bacterium]
MAINLYGFDRTAAVTIIPGGSAGAHTIDGDLDASGDELVSVYMDASGTLSDLTAEFSISGHNEIDNAAGTDSTGNYLIVTYLKGAGK